MRYPSLRAKIPNVWLMSDERTDATLDEAVEALPRGSGVIFRHYHLDRDSRRERFLTVNQIAKRCGHLILLADSPSAARKWGADGVHGRQWHRCEKAGLIHSAPVHNLREIMIANQNGADIFFLSPAFATRSHPGKRPLSHLHMNQLISRCDGPVILLGGMTAQRLGQRKDSGAHGWAGIDAFSKVSD
ncbi:thiamine phosphate synthase [Parasphingorhabdus sp.]|uniref:thiamine phosphate synthase n=1 Tax=Parasphingorhabdus sp. TaxID=2709688 RepID=UPI003267409C